jgi:intracellular septation protein A
MITHEIRTRFHAVQQRAAAVITAPETSMWTLVGGWWGLLDVLGPHLLFLTVYLVGGDLLTAVGVALAAALGLVVARLATFRSARHALGGAALVVVSGLIATTTGHDADFYLLQVLRSLALALLLLASMMIRRPLVGVILGPVIGGPSWRTDSRLLRAYWQCTALWAAVAIARSAVKLPLYLTDSVFGLGIAHLVTGLPVLAAMLYWQLRILRRAYASVS